MESISKAPALLMLLSVSLVWGQEQASLAKKHLDQGVAYLQANQPQRAEQELRRVIELDPGNAQAYNLLGSIYDYLGDPEKAETFFQKATQAAPSYPAPYNNLGISYLRQNKTDQALKAFNRALELDPGNPTTHYNLGLLFAKRGDLKESIAHLEQARSLKPGDTAILFNLASNYFLSGDLGRALPILQDLDRQPASARLPEVQDLLGTVLAQQGRVEEAIAHLSKAAELDPVGAGHHYKLALAFEKKGDLDNALREIQSAISLESRPSAPEYLLLGMIYRQKGNVEQASEAFKHAVDIAPDALATRFALGVLLRDAGYYQEAAREFERLRTAHPSFEVGVSLARTYYLAGDFSKSLSLLKQTEPAGSRPQRADFYKLLAEVYGKLEKWPEALDSLDKAIELDRRNSTIYFELGLVMINLNALRQAEELFLGVLKHLPESPELYVGLAQAKMFQDHYQQALEALTRAVSLDPNYSEAHYLMGNCLNEMNRYPEARQAYQKAIALSPDRDEFHFSLGSLLEKLGEEEAASNEFSKAISLNPTSADAHFRLGRLYLQKGDFERAETQLLKAIELKPKDPQGYEQLARIYLKTGRSSEARRTLETLQELKKAAPSPGRPARAGVNIRPVDEYLRFLNR